MSTSVLEIFCKFKKDRNKDGTHGSGGVGKDSKTVAEVGRGDRYR